MVRDERARTGNDGNGTGRHAADPVAPSPEPDRAPAPTDPARDLPPDGHLAGTPAATALPIPTTVPRRRWRVALTVETLCWTLIVAAAVLTRFWDLGSRALHHDESLHAYFSWLLATGQGYRHDPLMHGPFLFHATALVQWLFGDTDATSRVPAAVAGVAIVWLPWLLRGPRLLGRWGALFAGFLLLVSPAILYQSRYLRHDIFTVAGALLLFIAIVRYVDRPERRWLVTMGLTSGFLLANHEIVFGIGAIFVAVLLGALALGRLRAAGAVVAVTGVVCLLLLKIVPRLGAAPLPRIPWSNPTQDEQAAFYRALLTNPLILSLLAALVLGALAALWVIRRQYGPQRPPEGWVERVLGGGAPGSVQDAFRHALHDRDGLAVALTCLIVVFVLLFTTFFTNLYGLASGTFSTDGTLLYWLGQHDYRRGEQPWFYYLLLFPQYEFAAALLGTAMTAVVGWRALLVALGRRAPGPRFFTQTMLAVWYVGIFLALSWAGEKMPWLVVHITLPATLLAAALLGEFAERWVPASDPSRRAVGRGWGRPEGALVGGLLVAAGCWVLLAGQLTYGQFVPSDAAGGWSRELTAAALDHWWLLAMPPLAALVALAVAVAARGPRRAGAAALAALAAGLVLLQVHAGWRLTYLEGDVPKDMLVYTQTSPDVTRVVRELTTLSQATTGGNGLVVWYDDNNGVSWPMQWYLRDFPNRNLFGHSLSAPPLNAPIVLVGSDNNASVRGALSGYTPQTYVLRWWFPEDPIYRDFAIDPALAPGRSAWASSDQPHGLLDIARSVGSSLSQLRNPEGQARLYRLVMYRDLPARIDSYRFTLYVRNDLLPLYNSLRY